MSLPSKEHLIFPPSSLLSLRLSTLFVICTAGLGSACADPLPANQKQGSVHAFVQLRSAEGKVLAVGDLVQVTHGTRVQSRLLFHFRDGSVDDETTVFTQGKMFELVSDHHVQKGPTFPKATDVLVNVPTSEVTTRELKDGKEEVTTEHVDLPNDLVNGMVPLVLENISPRTPETKVSYLAASPKPMVVKMLIRPEGSETFRVLGERRRAARYTIHIELSGLAKVVAPIVGKQPSDIRIWVVGDEVATFVKLEGAFYVGGPIWTMEQAMPSFSKSGH